MKDPLLYKKINYIPISVIQQKTSQATHIPLELMLLGNKVCTARKREYVLARQISMTFSMKYTRKSLAVVGNMHGGRDHATTLHAVRTINNLIDTKNPETVELYNKTFELLKEWTGKNKDTFINKKEKTNMVKKFIKNKVPLEVRQYRLLNYKGICPTCGHKL